MNNIQPLRCYRYATTVSPNEEWDFQDELSFHLYYKWLPECSCYSINSNDDGHILSLNYFLFDFFPLEKNIVMGQYHTSQAYQPYVFPHIL